IWDRLLELKEKGITLLITTHYMEEAQKLCDRVLIMDQASEIDSGSPTELIRKHVPPYVLELRADRSQAAGVIATAGGLSYQTSGQNLYFYGGSPEDFQGLLAARPESERILRPSSLEDVFLKLTGREIRQ
ncbi:MAG: ABC transporter ATP-binding protein, partial [Actinomycetota bacterium]